MNHCEILRVTIEGPVAVYWRGPERVGESEAGPADYAAAGLPVPECSCGEVECRHGLAHYWGEGWSTDTLQGIAREVQP